MDEPQTSPQAGPTPTSKPKRPRWPLFVLLGILAAIPLWHQFIFMPRLRMTVFKTVIDDLHAQGEVTFVDEKGRDAYGMVSGLFEESGVKPIPLAQAKPAEVSKKIAATGSVVIKDIEWVGGTTFEAQASLNFGPGVGSGATYVLLPSLWDCQMDVVKDRWVNGVLVLPDNPAPKKKVMPSPQGG